MSFKLFYMETAGNLLCWVNPRFPSHCPQCGKSCYPAVKGWFTESDDNAILKLHGAFADPTAPLKSLGATDD